MIESLDKRLTEVREKIRYKQKLEKDLLQIKESLAAEREKCANLEKQLLKEGRDVKKLESLSLTELFLTILGSKEAQLEKERQEYLAAKLRYDECRSEIDPLEEKSGTPLNSWPCWKAWRPGTGTAGRKEAVIMSASAARPGSCWSYPAG